MSFCRQQQQPKKLWNAIHSSKLNNQIMCMMYVWYKILIPVSNKWSKQKRWLNLLDVCCNLIRMWCDIINKRLSIHSISPTEGETATIEHRLKKCSIFLKQRNFSYFLVLLLFHFFFALTCPVECIQFASFALTKFGTRVKRKLILNSKNYLMVFCRYTCWTKYLRKFGNFCLVDFCFAASKRIGRRKTLNKILRAYIKI